MSWWTLQLALESTAGSMKSGSLSVERPFFLMSYVPRERPINDLTKFQKAGALAVILAWTDVSDARRLGPIQPFLAPDAEVAYPALYIGKDPGAKLKALT